MGWRYVIPEHVPCEQCSWFEDGKCNCPSDRYEFECPNFNDPDPYYVPED